MPQESRFTNKTTIAFYMNEIHRFTQIKKPDNTMC